MKGIVFFLAGFLLLVSCAANKHIPEGKKHLHFIQYLEETGSAKKLKATFLFSSKYGLRPEVTVKIRLENGFSGPYSGGNLKLKLDREKFQLEPVDDHSAKNVFSIPENLWIPLWYSQNIGFNFDGLTKLKPFNLKPDVQENLKQFFKTAINQRKLNNPALPEGLKKW